VKDVVEALPVEQINKVTVITLQSRSVWCVFIWCPFSLMPKSNVMELLAGVS